MALETLKSFTLICSPLNFPYVALTIFWLGPLGLVAGRPFIRPRGYIVCLFGLYIWFSRRFFALFWLYARLCVKPVGTLVAVYTRVRQRGKIGGGLPC